MFILGRGREWWFIDILFVICKSSIEEVRLRVIKVCILVDLILIIFIFVWNFLFIMFYLVFWVELGVGN